MKLASAKVRMMGGVRTMDSRTVRPQPKTADPELLTAAHGQWALEVIRNADYRCQAIEDGRRCGTGHPARLYADHIRERSDGGAHLDVRNGQCLCARHHTLKTNRERAARLAERFAPHV